jgi:hypothetical protein
MHEETVFLFTRNQNLKKNNNLQILTFPLENKNNDKL